jgi:FKBP-type peptidyl-prolyl cis-trans isomerase FkpA
MKRSAIRGATFRDSNSLHPDHAGCDFAAAWIARGYSGALVRRRDVFHNCAFFRRIRSMLRTFAVAMAVTLAAPVALAQELKTEEDRINYAIGLSLAQSLTNANLSLTAAQLEFVKRGFMDGATGAKPAVSLDEYKPKIQAVVNAHMKEAAEKQKVAAEKNAALGKEYADKAAKEKGAVKTDSGLVYLSRKEGSGAHPKAEDTVKVKYRGTLIDGREFDNSANHGGTSEFQLNRVIKCWTEGIQKMKPGGTARLVCPSDIAYGERSVAPLIQAGSTLIFEVELIETKKP